MGDDKYRDQAEPLSLDDYVRLAGECLEKQGRWKEEPGWTLLQHGTPGVVFHEKMVPGHAIPMFKIQITLPVSVKEAAEFLEEVSIEVKQEFDPLIESEEVIEKINESISVCYNTYKGFFPVSKRDVVSMKCRLIQKDGTICFYGQSINYPKKPQSRSYVRAKGYSALWLSPVPSEPHKCQMVRMTLVEPMGSIPLWLITMGKNKSITGVLKMEELIKEKYKHHHLKLSSQVKVEGKDTETTDSEEFFDVIDSQDSEEEEESANQNIQIVKKGQVDEELHTKIVKLQESNQSLAKKVLKLEDIIKKFQWILKISLWLNLLGLPVFLLTLYHLFMKRIRTLF